MIRATISLLGIAAVAAGISCASASTLANPSFEAAITADGPPFVGFWEGFNSAAGTFSTTSDRPLTGVSSLTLTIIGDSQFAGAFQDVSVLPGQEAILSGWHIAPDRNDMVSEVRIEWRDSVADTEISRVQITPVPGTDGYVSFSLVDTVPTGANTGRVVYAVQTFGSGNGGSVHVDDLSFNLIPEPTAAVLLVLGGLFGFVRRRR